MTTFMDKQFNGCIYLNIVIVGVADKRNALIRNIGLYKGKCVFLL